MSWTLRQKEFFNRVFPEAQRASRETGIPAEVVFAQAALETGWGRSIPNNNYFGIKGAGQSQTTREFINGRWVTISDTFRGYSSLSDSISGYISFITNPNSTRWNNARSSKTVEEAARALQSGGYATDPNYADKLIGIAKSIPDELRNAASRATNIVNTLPNYTVPFTGANGNANIGNFPSLPRLPDLGSILQGAGDAVKETTETVTNPFSKSFDFVKELFSKNTMLRVVVVILGLILIGFAAYSLVNTSKLNVIDIAKAAT